MIVSTRHLHHFVLALALLLVGGVALRLTSCAPPREADPTDVRPPIGAAEPAPDPPVAADPTDPAPLDVIIYYPAAGENGLIGERHEIFRTTSPADRAKQIIADLIAGPRGSEALRGLPGNSVLRQVYVLEDGVAWIDFSAELGNGLSGGSQEELLAVYSIVDSVVLNISEIQRVGILIEGKPIETLNGHMDLRRPLPPDRSLIVGTGRSAAERGDAKMRAAVAAADSPLRATSSGPA